MSKENRHRRVYGIVHRTAGGWLKRKFNFNYEPYIQNDERPYIILSNHNTDFDPIMLVVAFRRHMYYVAADNIMRKGIASRALAYFIAPILKMKGKKDIHTVAEILRTLRRGNNVCIFAEGNKSFNGLTCDILPSTGQMVKMFGAGLITFRMSGGYLSAPRWATTLRKGRIDGGIVGIYTPEEIKEMTADEINGIIVRDLHEDAYETQREAMVQFKGERLAEGIESVLFICPACGRIGTLKGIDNRVTCNCGYDVEYTEYGFLEDNEGNRDTITECDRKQRQVLRNMLDTIQEEQIFCDDDVTIKQIGEDHQAISEETGRMEAYNDRIEICGDVMSFENIAGMSIFRRNCLMLNVMKEKGLYYEIQGKQDFNALKYLYLFEEISEEK